MRYRMTRILSKGQFMIQQAEYYNISLEEYSMKYTVTPCPGCDSWVCQGWQVSDISVKEPCTCPKYPTWTSHDCPKHQFPKEKP